ncbi:MAG TPA: DUF4301 family protein [bacterium]|nr:DUF4301 family protein [bacterium]
MNWSDQDIRQIHSRGMDLSEVERQLGLFRDPPAGIRLSRPARLGDGILSLSEAERREAIDRFEPARSGGRFQKFVPASGAASRMFQTLNKELNSAPVLRSVLERRAAQGEGDCAKVLEFLKSLPDLAFAGDLRRTLAGHDLDQALGAEDVTPILRALLGHEGLDYARKPKGLIPFHPDRDRVRDPFFEQLIEAEGTLADGRGGFKVHYTVSPEYLDEFRARADASSRSFLGKGLHPGIGFSAQKPSTDTLAVDKENRPFRDEKGELLFRPGGHGALIENLNDLKGDLVFIKNIDNVSTGDWFKATLEWKKILGGVLLQAEEKIRREGGPERPLRVCGVVRNTGEPGGGPFWVEGPQGPSLQIVESAQVDMEDPGQRAIFQAATHFNPVDLVCSVRKPDGTPFDLRRFVDPGAVFFSKKSYQGRDLKAFELPGLWNGAMAHWTTIFVEVPLETFNPVKTVFDLLKPAHR